MLRNNVGTRATCLRTTVEKHYIVTKWWSFPLLGTVYLPKSPQAYGQIEGGNIKQIREKTQI